MKQLTEFGKHYIVELIDCDPESIKFVENVSQVFLMAADEANATVIDTSFHQFEPFGVSGILLISESHLCLHTWPENGYVAFDIFTCGTNMHPDRAIQVLREQLKASDTSVEIITRGIKE